MPKAIYDGVEVEVSEPRLWPIEWVSFRCHPCTNWLGVDKYLDGQLVAKPILVCKDCLVVLDGWHRLASWWRQGRRQIWVQLADFHLGGARDECHINKVNWLSTLRPWIDLDCVSGSYHRNDICEPSFLQGILRDNRMPLMRQWEQTRATIFLGVVQGHRILDVGTRESIVPSYLAERGASVTAVDLGIKAVMLHSGVRVLQADATALPFEDNSFDEVVCTACVKHIPKDTQAVSEMLRVLKPHRLLALSFDFGQEYAEYPSEATGRRIYDKRSVYEHLIEPFREVATLCEPADFDRSDWTDWPIKVQAPSVFAKGVNVQVAFVLLRKKQYAYSFRLR